MFLLSSSLSISLSVGGSIPCISSCHPSRSTMPPLAPHLGVERATPHTPDHSLMALPVTIESGVIAQLHSSFWKHMLLCNHSGRVSSITRFVRVILRTHQIQNHIHQAKGHLGCNALTCWNSMFIWLHTLQHPQVLPLHAMNLRIQISSIFELHEPATLYFGIFLCIMGLKAEISSVLCANSPKDRNAVIDMG